LPGAAPALILKPVVPVVPLKKAPDRMYTFLAPSGIYAVQGADTMAGEQSKAIENDEIVRGLRERNPEVIDRLVDEYRVSLFRYLLSLTRNHHTAEDIFQETWLRVLQRGYQFRGTHSFRTWLFCIAKHLVIDLSRQTKPLASLDAMLEEDSRFQPKSAVTDSPLDHLHRHELQQCLHAQVRRLPRGQQEILRLRAKYELDLTEIAGVTKMPVRRVKQRFYRALGVLRSRLLSDQYRQPLGQLPARIVESYPI
jgi:RNA polymerase sigma-70 factor, ECF subfamily